MKFIKTEIPDVVIIEPLVYQDERGYFFESFRQNLLEEEIGKIIFIQENESKSKFGTLRGIHYQLPPYTQSKLVRVIRGKVQDIAVDLRKDSKYFGKYVSMILTAREKKQLFIPRGFGHAFLVLSKEAIFSYKVDNYYSKESERGILFDDRDLNIKWELPYSEIILSSKDKTSQILKNAELFKTEEIL